MNRAANVWAVQSQKPMHASEGSQCLTFVRVLSWAIVSYMLLAKLSKADRKNIGCRSTAVPKSEQLECLQRMLILYDAPDPRRKSITPKMP